MAVRLPDRRFGPAAPARAELATSLRRAPPHPAPGPIASWHQHIVSIGSPRKSSDRSEANGEFLEGRPTSHTRDPVISRLGGVLAAQRKRPGIERGIVEDESDAAVIQSPRALATIPERHHLREG